MTKLQEKPQSRPIGRRELLIGGGGLLAGIVASSIKQKTSAELPESYYTRIFYDLNHFNNFMQDCQQYCIRNQRQERPLVALNKLRDIVDKEIYQQHLLLHDSSHASNGYLVDLYSGVAAERQAIKEKMMQQCDAAIAASKKLHAEMDSLYDHLAPSYDMKLGEKLKDGIPYINTQLSGKPLNNPTFFGDYVPDYLEHIKQFIESDVPIIPVAKKQATQAR